MATAYQARLARIAQQQFEKFGLLRENQEPLATQIRAYWEDIGLTFPGVETAWSAVFVSWCVKKAGATKVEFKFAAAHSQFVYEAIANTAANTGVFRGRELSAYAPKVGDILQNNRSGGTHDFEFARTHKSYKSHSAIVIEVGSDVGGKYLRTIGGNESDSVGLKEVRLGATGLVLNSSGLYICTVETLL